MSTTLAVITGTSRGIGAGIAQAASASGAVLAVCNRTASGAERELLVDLSEPASWPQFADWFDALVDEIKPERVVFVHNAATITPIGFAGEVDAASYTTNVLLNSAAPQVIGGSVLQTATRTSTPTALVQLSSGAGKTSYPGWSAYCAAKAAVDMWVRTVGQEQAGRDNLVRALAIAPGVVSTGMQAEIRSSAADAFPQVDRFQDMHDTGALTDPIEVGAAIWTVADSGDWDNGAVLDVRNF